MALQLAGSGNLERNKASWRRWLSAAIATILSLLLVLLLPPAVQAAPAAEPGAPATSDNDEQLSNTAFAAEESDLRCIPLAVENPLDYTRDESARYVDNNVNVYAGNDLTLRNHEGEGLVLVERDIRHRADIRPASFTIGANVWGGSGSWPEKDFLMMAVGRNLDFDPNTADSIRVGSAEYPGQWFVGGDITPGRWQRVFFDYMRITDVDDLEDLEGTVVPGYKDRLDEFEDEIDELPRGKVEYDPAEKKLTLTGTNNPSTHVFELESSWLTTRGLTIDLKGEAETSAILRVDGEGTLNIPGHIKYQVNGKTINLPGPDISNWPEDAKEGLEDWSTLTQTLMWYFPDSPNINIGTQTGDHEMFTGSIYAADEDTHLNIWPSTNGRVISRGNLTFQRGHRMHVEDSGKVQWVGTEFHSFPFRFGMFECVNGVGFDIQKNVSGVALEDLEGLEFEIDASWVTPDWDRGEATYTLSNENGWFSEGERELPPGTEVTFREPTTDVPPGYEWAGVEWSVGGEEFDDDELTIELGEEKRLVTITATNTFRKIEVPVGGFNLQKQVVGLPIDELEGLEFKVEASWETPDGDYGSDTYYLPATGELVAGEQDLPYGTVVKFEEVDPVDVDGYELLGEPEIIPDEIIIGEDSAFSTVTVVNRYEREEPVPDPVGGFNLQKQVVGVPVEELESLEFKVEASWETPDGDYGSDTYYLPATGELVPGKQDLPYGTVVTFEEVDPDDIEIPGYDIEDWEIIPDEIIIGEESEFATVTLVNTYERQPVGGFDVQKQVVGLPADELAGLEFEVEASWNDDNGKKVYKSFTLSSDNNWYAEGPRDIPEGTEVCFEEVNTDEVDVEGYDREEPVILPECFYVGDGEVAVVTVKNVYNKQITGGFALQKTVRGDIGSIPPNASFEVTATWDTPVDTRHSATYTLNQQNNWRAEGPTDLPVGTEVWFEETKHSDIPGYEWWDVDFEPESLQIKPGIGVATVDVTNWYKREYFGTFKLAKELVWLDASGQPLDKEQIPEEQLKDLDFEVDLLYQLDGAWYTHTMLVPADGTPVESPKLPEGTEVFFSEPNPPVFDGFEFVVVDFYPGGDKRSITPATRADNKRYSLTIREGDASQNGVIYAENTYQGLGSVKLKKVVNGLDPADMGRLEDKYFSVLSKVMPPDPEGLGKDFSHWFFLPADGSDDPEGQDTLEGLPIGTKLRFDELMTDDVDIPGYQWVGSTWSAGANQVAPKGSVAVQALTTGVQGSLPAEENIEILATWSQGGQPQSKRFDVPLNGRQSLELTGLPNGTRVNLEQVGQPNVLEVAGKKYVWKNATVFPQQVTVTGGGVQPVTTRNVYEPQEPTGPGTFSLMAVLGGIDAKYFEPGAAFEVKATWGKPEVSCTFDVPVTGQQVTVGRSGNCGQSGSVPPTGARVDLDLKGVKGPKTPAGYTWSGKVVSSPTTIYVGQTGNQPVQLRTQYVADPPGGFNLQAVLQGVSASNVPARTVWTVEATVTEPGGQPYVKTFDLDGRGHQARGLEGLPVGTTVTFKQTARPNTVEGRQWQSVDISPQTLTVKSGTSPTIVVTNTYQDPSSVLGRLNVQAIVEGVDAEQFPRGSFFTVRASVTQNGKEHTPNADACDDGICVFEVPVTGEVTAENSIPVFTGVRFEFTEIRPPMAQGYQFDGFQFNYPTITINSNQNRTVTARNTYSVPEIKYDKYGDPYVEIGRGSGLLTVTASNWYEPTPSGGFRAQKVVSGVNPGDLPDRGWISLSWKAYGPGVDPDGENPEPFETGSLTLKPTGEIVNGPQNLPPGTTVTFSETSYPAPEEVVISPERLVIEEGVYDVTVTATNHYKGNGSGFNLQKVIDGVDPERFPVGEDGQEVTFHVKAKVTEPGKAPYEEEFFLPVSGQQVEGLHGLPVGTKVEFVEVTPPEVPGYSFENVQWSFAGTQQQDESPTLVIQEGSGVVAVVAKNTYGPEAVGGFEISKILNADANCPFDGKVFKVSATVTTPDGEPYDADGEHPDGLYVFELVPGGNPVGLPEVPVGSKVTIEEVEIPEVEGCRFDGVTWSVGDISFEGAGPHEIDIDDANVLQVKATNRYTAADLPDVTLPNSGGRTALLFTILAIIAGGVFAYMKTRKQA